MLGRMKSSTTPLGNPQPMPNGGLLGARLPVAEHEAGHVAIALALGIEVDHVTIDVYQQTLLGADVSAQIGAVTVTPENALRAALFAFGGAPAR